MSHDPPRFAIDERRWREQVVPLVLDEDLVLPHHDDEAPMGALELLIGSELPEGVLRSPDGWALHLIDDDEPDCCGMIVNVRATDPPGVMLSAGWLQWDNFLPDSDELDRVEAQSAESRPALQVPLLREAIDAVLSVANGLLAETDRPRRAAVVGDVVLGRLPDGLSEEQLARFAHALDHTSIGEVVAACLGGLDDGPDSSPGGER